MTFRDLFVLVFGGWGAIWGAFVWRTAWTSELPESVRQGTGWRRRVRQGLAVASPTGRLMPLVIVANWVLYAMFLCLRVSDWLGGAASRAFKTAGVVLLVGFVAIALLIVVVHLLKRPRFVIPPYARDERRRHT
jgi:hypothetical protein